MDQNNNLQVMLKNSPPFTDCKSEINNTNINNAKNFDLVMPIYNLIEYSKDYSKHQDVYGNTIELNQF